jgi:hypothetical protein
MITLTILTCLIFSSSPSNSNCCEGGKAAVDPCTICGLEVLKNTDQIDNETLLLRGEVKIAYRCVLCALADIKSDKKDLVIVAPSEKKGKPVKITRVAGRWTLEPETALFAYAKGSHAQCEIRYRALTTKDALEEYVQTNPKILASAKAISLADLIKRAG